MVHFYSCFLLDVRCTLESDFQISTFWLHEFMTWRVCTLTPDDWVSDWGFWKVWTRGQSVWWRVNFPYREKSLESRIKWVGGVSHQTFSLYNVNVWFSIKCTHFRIVFSSTNFTLILKFGKVKHRGKTISTLSSEKVECRVNLGLGYTNGETEKREWLQDDFRFSSPWTSVQLCKCALFFVCFGFI